MARLTAAITSDWSVCRLMQCHKRRCKLTGRTRHPATGAWWQLPPNLFFTPKNLTKIMFSLQLSFFYTHSNVRISPKMFFPPKKFLAPSNVAGYVPRQDCRMHIKIITNMRYKRKTLVGLRPISPPPSDCLDCFHFVCSQSLSDFSDSNIIDNFLKILLRDPTQPNPWMHPTPRISRF